MASYSLTNMGYRTLRTRLRALRFEPAMHNGLPLEVFANFTLVAQKADDHVNFRLLMNQQHSRGEFDLAYSAPQRIRVGSMWSRSRVSSGSIRVNVMVDVDTAGHASNARVLDNSLAAAALDDTLASRMESACFVPGHSEGEPAEMVYSELFEQG